MAKDEVAELCFECHTADNNTPDPIIPKLIGQRKEYLLKEINSFRMGRRNDTTMIDIARNLTDEKQILEIIEFYSSQPTMSGTPENSPVVSRGRSLYQARRCDFCHGINGKSKNTYIDGAPIIGGQNSEYLYKTLLELRNNTRPTDKFGLMLKSILQLSSDDIEAISRYLATL
ncbi:MAG: c-type cytochrome [Candidatus Thiodiazotropha sp.]